MLSRLALSVLAAGLLAAAPLPYVYSAPAGDRPAGAPNPTRPYDVILPNGRIVAPIGASTAVGRDAFSFALAPGARYAIVADGGLRVVDLRRMTTVDLVGAGEGWGGGVAAFHEPGARRTLVLASNPRENAVALLYLTPSGTLTMLHRFVIDDPGAIAMAADHRTAYIVERMKDRLVAVDLVHRTIGEGAEVGFTPEDVVATRYRVYVTNPGITPEAGGDPAQSSASQQASALTAVALRTDGEPTDEGTLWTALDEPVNGTDRIGGAYPGAIALAKNRRFAYICMQNVDRVAVLDVWDVPRVVAGLQLRLFDKSPYGTQPDALAISPNGKRLYVALAGLNAVAVLDARNPVHLHRLGLIPTGWYPGALAASPDGRYLYVLNARGNGETGSLERIDLRHLPLAKTTLSALRYTRVPHPAAEDAIVPPLRSQQRSSAIAHVVFIRAGEGDWESMMGPGTESMTPNLHALAARFALAADFYAEGPTPATAAQIPLAGLASTAAQRYGASGASAAPRDGDIFNAVARAGLTYRDYRGTQAQAEAGTADTPAMTYVDLPDGTPAQIDAAVGTIVDRISHEPDWNSTAIFIAPGALHGDVMARSFALVVSPYARRGAGTLHVSMSGIVKTEEELLGLEPLSLGDLLSSDLSGFFDRTPDDTPYRAQSGGAADVEPSGSP